MHIPYSHLLRSQNQFILSIRTSILKPTGAWNVELPPLSNSLFTYLFSITPGLCARRFTRWSCIIVWLFGTLLEFWVDSEINFPLHICLTKVGFTLGNSENLLTNFDCIIINKSICSWNLNCQHVGTFCTFQSNGSLVFMFISYPIDFFLDIFDIVVYHTLHLRTQCVNSTRTRIIYAHSTRTFWNQGQPNVSLFWTFEALLYDNVVIAHSK